MGDHNRDQFTQSISPSAPPLSLASSATLDRRELPLYDIQDLPSGPVFNHRNPYAHLTSKIFCAEQGDLNIVTPPPDAVDDDREPTAPPLDLMDIVEGYEDASFEAVEIPPPLLPAICPAEEAPQRSPLPNIPTLTEREVRQALLKEVGSHCCYGSGAARDMAITDIKHSIAFRYTIETFTEKRKTCWAYEPYTGDAISAPTSGGAPSPWDVDLPSPKPFSNQVSHIEVPHTASAKTCHTCGGIGRKRCLTCSGNGWEYCYSCHGDGVKPLSLQGHRDERCYQCHGTGRRKCWKCNGDGMAVCVSCAGTGQIKCFIRLTVEWINHLDDYVLEKTSAIQEEKLRLVGGRLVFSEEEPMLWPLTHFPDIAINMASAQLIQEHATSFAGEKILLQRQSVRVIPIAAVSYKWKSYEGMYHVFGYEQKVYAPDYPQTCCCCVIL